MWALIRLWGHTVCKNDFLNHKQMTKQMIIVVIGSLRVKARVIIAADNILKILIFYCSKQIRFNILCELSVR